MSPSPCRGRISRTLGRERVGLSTPDRFLRQLTVRVSDQCPVGCTVHATAPAPFEFVLTEIQNFLWSRKWSPLSLRIVVTHVLVRSFLRYVLHCVHEENADRIRNFAESNFSFDNDTTVPEICVASESAVQHGMLIASSSMPGIEQPTLGVTLVKSHGTINTQPPEHNFKLQVYPTVPAEYDGFGPEQWLSVMNLAPISGVDWWYGGPDYGTSGYPYMVGRDTVAAIIPPEQFTRTWEIPSTLHHESHGGAWMEFLTSS